MTSMNSHNYLFLQSDNKWKDNSEKNPFKRILLCSKNVFFEHKISARVYKFLLDMLR